MSLREIFLQANNAKPSDFLPLIIGTEKVGLIAKENEQMLADYGFILQKNLSPKARGECFFWQGFGREAENTAYIADITQRMAADGLVTGWRDELYALSSSFFAPPQALLERAAVPLFGATGYGIHLNGLVRKGKELWMWLGKRAANKQTSPGQWDQIAAGGLPYGMNPFRNMQKECAEEAGIPEDLSAKAYAVGMGSYFRRLKIGIRPDQMFLYDLWLEQDFVPQNMDQEVEQFALLPLKEIIENLRTGRSNIKYNSAIVIIDCALRYGIISPEDPEYCELCAARSARQFWTQDFSNFY